MSYTPFPVGDIPYALNPRPPTNSPGSTSEFHTAKFNAFKICFANTVEISYPLEKHKGYQNDVFHSRPNKPYLCFFWLLFNFYTVRVRTRSPQRPCWLSRRQRTRTSVCWHIFPHVAVCLQQFALFSLRFVYITFYIN